MFSALAFVVLIFTVYTQRRESERIAERQTNLDKERELRFALEHAGKKLEALHEYVTWIATYSADLTFTKLEQQVSRWKEVRDCLVWIGTIIEQMEGELPFGYVTAGYYRSLYGDLVATLYRIKAVPESTGRAFYNEPAEP